MLIPVLLNDGDPEGQPLTIINISLASNGIAVINPNGTITYSPLLDFSGVDSFNYTVSDSGTAIEGAGISTGKVTVTIADVNDPPVAVLDSYTLIEGGILDTKIDGLDSVLLNDTDVEGNDLEAILTTEPANAISFVLGSDGHFRYIHDGSETTIDSFFYFPSDGKGTEPVQVTITIIPQNDAPIAVDDSYVITQGGIIDTASSVTIDGVLENDSDEEGDSISAILITSPAHAADFVLSSNGDFVYEHDGSETTTDSFRYQTTDGSLTSNIATAFITIISTTTDTIPPVITVPQNIAVDVPGAESTIVVYSGESAIDNVDGIVPVSCTPTSGSTFSLGETIVTCTASDSAENTASATFSITVSLLPTPGKVTAGGAQLDKDVNFGFNIQSEDGVDFKGQLQYNDKASDIKLHSDEMILLSVDPAKIHAIFTGTASIGQQSGFTFTIKIQDNGEPGTNDYFSITIFDSGGSSIYQKDGILEKGNIQVHE